MLGEENEELLLNVYRVVWSDEKVLEIDSGEGYTILCMYLMSLNCTLKMILLHIFYYFKKSSITN